MLSRYRHYVQSHPLQGWLITVAVLLVYARVVTWIWPDKSKAGVPTISLLLYVAFSAPTVNLMLRLSEEERRKRPISPSQERGISFLSLVAAICGIGGLIAGIYGRWAGWTLDTRMILFPASFIAAAVGAGLGYGVRQRQVGRWALGLSVFWGMLLIGHIVSMLWLRSSGHT